MAKSKRKRHGVFFCLALVAASLSLMAPNTVQAYQAAKPAPAPVDQVQVTLNKCKRLLRSGKTAKAQASILQTLSQVDELKSCFALADFTESYGYPLMDTRRQCINKALELARSEDDLMQVALRARKYQFYEITHAAVTALFKHATTQKELMDLADRANKLSLTDIAHISLEKALLLVSDQKNALEFAGQAKALGGDDLAHKCLKSLIDGKSDPADLLDLLGQIEPMGWHDLNHYLLRKALDGAVTTDQYAQIRAAAERLSEQDVREVCDYRMKKLQVLEQIKSDQAAYQKKLEEWQAEKKQEDDERQAREDAQRQVQDEADRQNRQIQLWQMQQQSQMSNQKQSAPGQAGRAQDGQPESSGLAPSIIPPLPKELQSKPKEVPPPLKFSPENQAQPPAEAF